MVHIITITFYFLLHIGEYTKPKRKTRTVQFQLKDVAFWKEGMYIDYKTAIKNELLIYDRAIL